MGPKFVVYVADTLAGPRDRRIYKTFARAMDRFEELRRTVRRNGHNYVALRAVDGSIEHIG